MGLLNEVVYVIMYQPLGQEWEPYLVALSQWAAKTWIEEQPMPWRYYIEEVALL